MKTDFTTGAKILFIASLAVIATAYVSADWVDSCGTPEECNAKPPIHEGSEDQVKDGGLSVNTFGVRDGATTDTIGYVLTQTDNVGTAEWKPASGAGGVFSATTYVKSKNVTAPGYVRCNGDDIATGGSVEASTGSNGITQFTSRPARCTSDTSCSDVTNENAGQPNAWKCAVNSGVPATKMCYVVCANVNP